MFHPRHHGPHHERRLGFLTWLVSVHLDHLGSGGVSTGQLVHELYRERKPQAAPEAQTGVGRLHGMLR